MFLCISKKLEDERGSAVYSILVEVVVDMLSEIYSWGRG